VREVAISIPVKAPRGFALAFLNTYVQDRATDSGEPRFRLRVPLKHFAGGARFERDVAMHVDWIPKEPGEATRLSISWTPIGSRLFPGFDGTIEAFPDAAECCTLTMTGRHHAPPGVAGNIFAAVMGDRIARASMDDLLRFFRGAIEADYLERISSS
jgi:hypothetical protein